MASWEITSERARLSGAPSSEQSDHKDQAQNGSDDGGDAQQYTSDYPTQQQQQPPHLHLQYQNGGVLSLESLHHNNINGSSRHGSKPRQLQQPPVSLEDFHSLFRTPHHVADSQYRAYLMGQTARRKGPAPILTKICCAQGCAFFSAIAVLFLFFVGFMLDTQPLYIKGALPKIIVQTDDGGRPVTQYILPTTERLPTASAAYQAGVMYLFVIGICLYVLYPGWFQNQWYRRQHRYQDIPDHVSATDSTLPTFHTAISEEVEAAASSRAYTPNIFTRSTDVVKQWLAVRGWYKPGTFRKRKHYQKTG